jgi:hypothetical protein
MATLVPAIRVNKPNTPDELDDLYFPAPVVPGLEIPAHDYLSCSYTGSNLTGVVYKSGGASGTVVATLTLAYDGSNNLASVTKS